MRCPAAGWIGLMLALPASAQPVDVFSEFHRLDPFGAVVAADRGAGPREILSPAVARNGHASFHVAVTVPAKESYLLYVVTNPLDACRVSLYKEHFVDTPSGWIPDRLVELHRLPDFGTMPDPEEKIDGQTTRLYLLDLWIPPDAPVARFRLEVQLKVAGWTIRPLEVRVLQARIPDAPAAAGDLRTAPLPPLDAGADRVAWQALADYLSGAPPRAFPPPATLQEVIRRNAAQDFALARSLDQRVAGRGAIAERFLTLWPWRRFMGAERYLRVRDFLYSQFAGR